MGASWILSILVIAVMVLAGCSGGEVTPAAGGDLSTPDAGDGSSSLVVLVVDDSLSPVQGATVALVDLDDVAGTTNDGGQVVFEGLEPGRYQVIAQKLGYDSVGRSVDVAPDAESTLQIELQQLRVEEAYHEIIPYVGFMSCGFGLIAVTATSNCLDSPNHQVTWDTEVGGGLKTILGELVWEQTSSLSATELRLVAGMDESCNPCSFEHSYGSVVGPSPLILQADEKFDGIEDEAETYEIRHRIWVPFSSDTPPIVIIVLEQPVELYVTSFYGEPMADGFTAMPDA